MNKIDKLKLVATSQGDLELCSVCDKAQLGDRAAIKLIKAALLKAEYDKIELDSQD